MCVLFMKNFLSLIRATWWVLHSFRPPEPKNVWFLLSRHHVRRVHEKFSCPWFERAICRLTHFGLLSPRTFHSYFLDIMYVDIIKKIFLAHSSELMGVRLISASWAKNAWFLLSRHHVRRVHEKFSSRRFERDICCLTHFGLLSPKTFDSYFTDTMYVEGMKNFFYPIRANGWVLHSFRLAEPKNVCFLLSRHDVRQVHEKFSSRRFGRAICCLTHFDLLSPKTFDSYFTDTMYVEGMKDFFYPIRANGWVLHSFRLPEPKNVWFLLSRHDVRQVHEKFSSRRFGRAICCLTHFGLLSAKTFDSYFIDIMYVEFMSNFFQADSSELMGVRLISASWAQKRFIATFWTSCPSSSWKISSRRFEPDDGC